MAPPRFDCYAAAVTHPESVPDTQPDFARLRRASSRPAPPALAEASGYQAKAVSPSSRAIHASEGGRIAAIAKTLSVNLSKTVYTDRRPIRITRKTRGVAWCRSCVATGRTCLAWDDGSSTSFAVWRIASATMSALPAMLTIAWSGTIVDGGIHHRTSTVVRCRHDRVCDRRRSQALREVSEDRLGPRVHETALRSCHRRIDSPSCTDCGGSHAADEPTTDAPRRDAAEGVPRAARRVAGRGGAPDEGSVPAPQRDRQGTSRRECRHGALVRSAHGVGGAIGCRCKRSGICGTRCGRAGDGRRSGLSPRAPESGNQPPGSSSRSR